MKIAKYIYNENAENLLALTQIIQEDAHAVKSGDRYWKTTFQEDDWKD